MTPAQSYIKIKKPKPNYSTEGFKAVTAVYLGAQFARRGYILERVVPPLERAGHTITSSWLMEAPGAPVLGADDLLTNAELGRAKARECLRDIDRAEEVVILTLWPSSTGGFEVEYGYALHSDKPVTIVGPEWNVFHALNDEDGVTRYTTLEDFLQARTGERLTV